MQVNPQPKDWAILVPLLFISGCAAIPYDVDNYPKEFITRASGTSMLPAFPADGLIKVTRVPYEQLVKGLTVSYVNPFAHTGNDLVNHRLFYKSGDNWVAKGDNNSGKDIGLVTRFNYIGVTTPVAA